MRRNMTRGGSRRGMNQGPLVTEHLQDLDLELELLKRKRQVIQEQQELLRQSNFGPSSYHEHHRFDDYSYLYDRRPTPSFPTDYGTQLGKRRHTISPWQDEAGPPKRYPNYRGKSPRRPFDDRQVSRLMDQRPSSQLFVRRPHAPIPGPSRNAPPAKPSVASKKPVRKPLRTDFKPSKVTKPKDVATGPNPNKLASYPVETRKKLVSETVDPNLILKAGSEPNKQITGRLELALGHILKELKLAYSTNETYSVCFGSQIISRVMKQGIRERVRNAMIGQAVGNVQDIIDRYRKVFPPAMDVELLELALNKDKSVQAMHDKCIEEEEPERFFNVNMHRILDKTLNEMFVKLQNIYSNIVVPKLIGADDDVPEGEAQNTETNLEKPTDNASDIEKPNESISNIEKCDEEKTNNENEVASIEATPNDGQENETTVDEVNTTEENPDEANSTEPNTDTPMLDAEENKADNSEAKDPPTKEADGETSKGDQVPDVPKTDVIVKRNRRPRRSKNSEIFIESVIKRKMPYMLQKYIPHIIKLLNLDHMYKAATADIFKTTIIKKKKAVNSPKKEMVKEKTSRNEKTAGNTKPSDNANATTTTKANGNAIVLDNSGNLRFTLPPPKYFVKIIARPSLPKRKLMQNFLDKYKPRTIKKHKRVHSLLFVGFVNKEDFDNILAATGTVIGRVTLDIKVSERGKNNDNANDGDATVDSIPNEADESAVSELNDQIDDLLTSIRQAEEEDIVFDENSIKTEQNNTEATDEYEQSQYDITEDCAEENVNTDENEIKNETADVHNSEEATTKNEETENDIKNETADVNTEEETSNNDENVIKNETVDDNIDSGEATTNNDETEDMKVNQELSEIIEKADKVGVLKKEIKEPGRNTPTRASARLNTTPSTIKTRRASKLAQN